MSTSYPCGDYPPYIQPMVPWPNTSPPYQTTYAVPKIKQRKYRRSCKVISITANIAYSKKRTVDERLKELKDLRDYIGSLMESITPKA